jgi:hypothetical protein
LELGFEKYIICFKNFVFKMNDIKTKKFAVFIAIFQLSRKEKYIGEHFFLLKNQLTSFLLKNALWST